MRCRFDGDTHPQLPQYVNPFRLNEPLDGGGIGRIIRSKVSNLKPKDYVVMPFVGYPWKTRCVLDLSDINSSTESELGTFHIAANDVEETQVSHLLGVVGMPGLTAYCGIVRTQDASSRCKNINHTINSYTLRISRVKNRNCRDLRSSGGSGKYCWSDCSYRTRSSCGWNLWI